MQVDPSRSLEEACRDGTLIVSLLHRLERCQLPGVSSKPRSPAAALFNLRAVLRRLADKPAMPATLLWSEHQIVEGVAGVAANLLWQMHAVYSGKL
jgi:hypothetical protein